MKIVIDLQGAQGEGSQNRGIGRYTTQWALEVLKRAGNHDVWLVLNGGFPDSIEEITERFRGLLPENKIRVWENPLNVRHLGVGNQKQRRISERMREAFIKSMKPDIVHVSSLFEGLSDNIVTSIGNFDSESSASVTLYDLIPYIYQDRYLKDKAVTDWYLEKIKYLTRANCWMAISESARQDAIQRLGFSPDRVFNISAAADANFRPANLDREQSLSLFDKYKLARPFVLYTGGIDFRKNIDRLLEAYSILPIEVRKGHQLVIVCKVSDHERNVFNRLIAQLGLQNDDVIFTGFVGDCDLVNLYSTCKAFVFPSLYEGFGLGDDFAYADPMPAGEEPPLIEG